MKSALLRKDSRRCDPARSAIGLRMRLSCGASICPGIKNNLGAVVLLVAEYLVHLWRLINRHTMTDDEARIDLAALHAIEQRLHVTHHVGLTGFHGERL